MMTTPYEAYTLYLGLKCHFTQEKYDFIQYNGKLRTRQDSFDTRKDKYMFYKLSKKKDLKNFLISNLSKNGNLWIGKLLEDEGQQTYMEWKKRSESLTYVFQNEIKNLDDDLNKNFEVNDGQHPYIVKLFQRKKISLETFIILDDILSFCSYVTKRVQDTILWPKIVLQVKKYRPFFEYDKDKMKAVLKKQFTNTYK